MEVTITESSAAETLVILVSIQIPWGGQSRSIGRLPSDCMMAESAVSFLCRHGHIGVTGG